MSNLSGNYRKTDGDIYCEEWNVFGNNLKEYIKSNKDGLIEDSFDVILGFSRGGTVLAYSFACLLKDMIDEYSDTQKACVRSIPKGFTCKKKHPCFVMDHPTSFHEKEDIEKFLVDDLKELSVTRDNLLNILIMDDNLTGATRIRFLKDELNKLNCVNFVKTLAYVRHDSFLSISTIPTIRKFPQGFKVFVMPWHKPHNKRELDVESEKINGYEMSVLFRVEDKFNLQHFEKTIRKLYAVEQHFIINGASNFYIRSRKVQNADFVELRIFIHMFYPPKQCLKSEFSDATYEEIDISEFFPICSSGITKSMNSCLTCSHLNCNKRLFKTILNITKSQSISFEIKNNEKLEFAINDWFLNSMPEVKLTDFSND